MALPHSEFAGDLGEMTTRQRIGVFGGTFDPVHVGHLIVATELRHVLDLDQVLFVPAGRPPHTTSQEISDDEDRLAMLRLAIGGDPAFDLCTLDVDRGGLSYTADTLAMLGDDMGPNTELLFLMGQDSFRDLPLWDRPERIVRLAEIGVALRPGTEVDPDLVFAGVPTARGRVHIVPVPLIDVSSRDLRRRVATGAPIAYQVPPAVEEYIRGRRLYEPKTEKRMPPPIGR